MHLNFASVLLNKRFADSQTQANSVSIELLVAIFELAKSFEQLLLIFFRDANAVVAYFHIKAPQRLTIVGLDLNDALVSKLEGVLNQVDQDLLQSALVAQKQW